MLFLVTSLILIIIVETVFPGSWILDQPLLVVLGLLLEILLLVH